MQDVLLAQYLVDNRAQIALVIPAGYGEDVAALRPPRLQVLADGTDSNSAVVGLGWWLVQRRRSGNKIEPASV